MVENHPRRSDGKLRYVVVLPESSLSITCDEDLMNVIQEYDRVAALTNQEMKIRAVLFPVNSAKKISPPTSPMSLDFPASRMKPEKVRCFYSPPSYRRQQLGVTLQFWDIQSAEGKTAHLAYGFQLAKATEEQLGVIRRRGNNNSNQRDCINIISNL
ncbi:hypothetical protein HAX54_053393 [Datura stramonium]|uniref:Uncharacterized protein n=1 Tax=Datura stramonium TaxID=4076 RepID=A0ABS8T180_DATST|nr:hypothetical protein [Datura stramonium]